MPDQLFSRRFVTTSATGSVIGALLAQHSAGASGTAQLCATPQPTRSAPDFASEVDAGLDYFQQRADEQLPLVEALRDAIASGDLEMAKAAYVSARPPYEEIEALAANFPDTDEAIDARPYAFDEGESSPNFKGFHKLEILLFRDNDLDSALPAANELIGTIETLQHDLTMREKFSASGQFDGIIALANEVASKKVSSEEETWSDQSMVIFKHNWIGVWSQYEPFAPAIEAVEPAIAADVETSYQEAMAIMDSTFEPDGVTAIPYSQVSMETRSQIVAANYSLRDALQAARDAIGIGVA